MGFLDSLNPVSAIVETVGKVASDLITTDKERMQLELDGYNAETERLATQTRINEIEASSTDHFVSRWRPALGWVGVIAMAYQFILYPLLVWGWAWLQAMHYVSMAFVAPPQLQTDSLWVILTGLLGIGGMRSLDKIKGVSK